MSQGLVYLITYGDNDLILFVCFLVIFILFIIVVIFIDSNRFVVRKYELSSKKVKEAYRFVFLSDLHNKVYGENNEKLLKAVDMLKPDAVLVGGDMMTAYPGRDFSAALDFVSAVNKKHKMIYAMGNHEYRAKIYPEVYGDLYKNYSEALEKENIRFLDNERENVGEDISVYGFTMESPYYRRFKLEPMAEDYVEKMIGANEEEKFSILLAHNPEYFEKYAIWKPDLVLSGHLHGGVARIPGWRGIISPMWHLFPKYGGGCFAKNGSKMIVSRGLGMHTIPLRLFNPAEIVVIDVKKA